jgi:adenine-specific DNA-methyltransferase
MQRLTPDSPELKSADLVAENIERLRELFPEAFANEGKIDFDVLRQLLGDRVDDAEERYGLNWHGKRAARQLALTPSTGTLRPCPEESVDWDTTQNIFIEGDNLEVLKLLQKSYAGKVKLIYIDPPYNTGKDFVYPDNFQDSIRNYLEITGQVEGGQKLTSNTEASGRFHTDWLNMLFPRLKACWQLLRLDGLLCVSIHHKELANLVTLLEELFGSDSRVGIITWKARVKPVNVGEAKYRPQNETEYVVIVQRSDTEGKFQPLYTGGVRSYPHELNGRKYRLQTILKSNRGANYRSTMSFELHGYKPPEGQRWQGGEDEITRLHTEGYLEFRDGTPFRRYFEDEEGAEHDPLYCFMETEWSSTSEAGKHELNELLGNDHGFDTVKPVRLIRTLIQATTRSDQHDLVLDFFAGSGTTAHAVFAQNAGDRGLRRTISVQLPEPLSTDVPEQKSMAQFCDGLGKPRTIAEVSKERLRRVIKTLKEDDSSGDLGFRVFKLDTSNIRPWEASRETLAEALTAAVDHVKPHRTENDLLYDIILKHGLDLCAAIEEKRIGDHKVRSVGGGAVFACFGSRITASDVEQLADGIAKWRDELAPANPELSRVVFRDSAFETDVAKTNLALILKERGFDEKLVVSL